MKIPRIYTQKKLQNGSEIILDINASKHILHVLRLQLNSSLVIFNSNDGDYLAKILAVNNQSAIVKIIEFLPNNAESPLKIQLAQAICKGDKMDFIIQKAVELGVNKITPLFTAQCDVKLDNERAQKKQQRWQTIAINACEQCGRNKIPIIEKPQQFKNWLSELHLGLCLTFHPEAEASLANLPITQQACTLLIGPEGGLNEIEIQLATKHKFTTIKLGPRILRTETAGLAAISVMQTKWGDMR